MAMNASLVAIAQIVLMVCLSFRRHRHARDPSEAEHRPGGGSTKYHGGRVAMMRADALDELRGW